MKKLWQRRFLASLSVGALLAASGDIAQADHLDDIGYRQLVAEFGTALPSSGEVSILQVEASRDGGWAPWAAGDTQGKSVTYLGWSTPPPLSNHAFEVGQFLVGLTQSALPWIPSWLATDNGGHYGRSSNSPAGLNCFIFFDPRPQPTAWDIENHSWGGFGSVVNHPRSCLQKLDHIINRDGVLVVAAVPNASQIPVLTQSPLWSTSYNALVIGSSTGDHAHGVPAAFEGVQAGLTLADRLKPDMVGGATFTSYATPIVSSAAGLLVAEIKRSSALSLAKEARVLKAALMAGATKEEFPSWNRTTSRPLDPVYGAGELNILRSYKLLIAGRRIPDSIAATSVAGWDFNQAGASAGSKTYYFQVAEGTTQKLSSILVWNRRIRYTPGVWEVILNGNMAIGFYDHSDLPDFSLKLYSVSPDGAPLSLVDSSDSASDNIEHIYQEVLPPGRYALKVELSGIVSIDYDTIAGPSLRTASFNAATQPEPYALANWVQVSGTAVVDDVFRNGFEF